ncbi:hypothetical protein BKG76_00330 [Mycobacteroides franklinii]|uniref:Uncharacterized protein n=1 Tax=Mycobacteroides franklinii TaxID=948102 RepID=A0A1S1LF33_9MYCO|nr:hypothetical protein [Mycobacteroides franklinii]OHU31698.1 hypothetical protein BKG76_00330 [Mycobacteroides franklinii]
MGSIHDYVPIQLTNAFRRAQQNTKFRSWLDMQDAVMAIEFPFEDCPEVAGMMYTQRSLGVVEAKILSFYDCFQDAWDAKNIHTTMRFVYYIGETYRRGFEGAWAALPKFGGGEDDNTPVVDFPFRDTLFKPMESVQVALVRRTGSEIAGLYPYAQKDFQEWVEAGRPERTYRGTLREDD